MIMIKVVGGERSEYNKRLGKSLRKSLNEEEKVFLYIIYNDYVCSAL